MVSCQAPVGRECCKLVLRVALQAPQIPRAHTETKPRDERPQLQTGGRKTLESQSVALEVQTLGGWRPGQSRFGSF